MVLALVCAVLFLSVIPVAAIRFIRNRRVSGARAPTSRGARAAGWIILALCVLNLLFLAGFAVLFMAGWDASWGFPSELHGLTPLVKTVLGLGVASAVLTVGALVFHVRRGEYRNILLNLILLLVAAFVGLGLWPAVPVF